jgi:inactivated superfamily I helicase
MTTTKSITAMRPRVFTIPPSAPFLPTLIKAMMAGKLGFRSP